MNGTRDAKKPARGTPRMGNDTDLIGVTSCALPASSPSPMPPRPRVARCPLWSPPQPHPFPALCAALRPVTDARQRAALDACHPHDRIAARLRGRPWHHSGLGDGRRLRFPPDRGNASAATGPDRDHTVKLIPGGLQPGTVYWYRFSFGGAISATGRTRTAPAAGAAVDRLRMGVVSCANWQAGCFSAYRYPRTAAT